MKATRQQIKKLHAELEAAARKIYEENGFTYISSRVSYTDTSAKFTCEGIVKVDEDSIDTFISQNSLQSGFAQPNTICYFRGKNGFRKVRILKARRTKYVFEFIDEPGMSYLANFRGFHAENK